MLTYSKPLSTPPIMTALAVLDALVVLTSLSWISTIVSRKRKVGDLPLPPGPPPMPIVGNFSEMLLPESWVIAMEWAKKYGEPFYSAVRNMSVNSLLSVV